MSLTRIGSIGINTGIAFAGVTTIVTLNTANDALSIGATVNVGSGITLGASGDIFATGVSTVTTLKVGSGVTASSDGDIFATGVTTSTTFSGAFSGSGANITALNASNLASGTVPTARLGSGTASSSTFLRGDSTFQTVNTDLVSDTSPQLGGNLDVNGKNITFADSSDGSSDDVLSFGAGTDLKIYHDGTNNVVKNTTTGELRFMYDSQYMLRCIPTAAVRIYYANSTKAQTTNTGFMVNGNLELVDGNKLYLGDSGDLQIYHVDNTDKSHIKDTSGILYYESDNHFFKSGDSGEFMAKFIDDGAVELYHDNTKRLETQSGGVRIRDRLGVNCDPNSSHPMQVDHDQQYIIAIRNTAADSSNFPWLCHKEINSKQAFAIHINGISGDPFHVDQDGAIYLNKETSTANALKDYEEGTFTPTYDGTWTNISNSNLRQAKYTKIGNIVHVYMEYYMTGNNGEFATNSNIRGFPFTGTNNPADIYVPVNLSIMYGPSGYSMDSNSAGRAYFTTYDDRLYFNMGAYNGIRHIWIQLTYHTTY